MSPSTSHVIGDPITVPATATDPIVKHGLRAVGAGVRVCSRCGTMVVPAHRSKSNFRHVASAEARVLLAGN